MFFRCLCPLRLGGGLRVGLQPLMQVLVGAFGRAQHHPCRNPFDGIPAPGHARHQVDLGRFEDPVEMLRLRPYAGTSPPFFLAGFGDGFTIILPIHIIQEDVVPAVAPVIMLVSP